MQTVHTCKISYEQKIAKYQNKNIDKKHIECTELDFLV